MIEITENAPDAIEEVEVQLNGELPDALPVLPLKETVTFPDAMTPLAVGQERSVKLVNDVLAGQRMLVMVASKDPELDEPGPGDLYRVGVVGIVARMLKVPDGTLRILVQGAQRIQLDDYIQTEPYLVARITELPDVIEESQELEALRRNVQSTFSDIIAEVPYLPEELQVAVANVDDPVALAHMIAGALRIKTEEKQELLEELDVSKRLRKLSEILAHELEMLELGSKIQSQVQSEMDKTQREYFLRQQLKAIQDELGEADPEHADVEDLRKQIEDADLPEEARKQAEREVGRLERIPSASPEYGVIRSYLEWILAVPWGKTTEDNLDLDHAREVLNEDHYDIEKVKERIREYLAVRKLTEEAGGPILCFVGPPGVGKTSLGKSIARAMGREFARISVGGVRDEAEIRGHRRTYVGALPGTIVRSLRDAGTMNPVFMIDEIDKMGADFRGDPSSAMLEVLDPEQNDSFRDHYLDLPVDLSNVMFICTANQLETIPGPLQDRMEVIRLAGYTEEEKLHIARRYLVPRQIERNGLKPDQIEITDEAIRATISDYTREAGVRNLERELGALMRKVALEVAEGKAAEREVVDADRAHELLGKRKFHSEAKRRTQEPGVATGLAWTAAGGDVLFVEATSFPGSGKLQITGQLGDVMKESAQAAFSYVKANAEEWGAHLPADWFQNHDLHVHVPAGAIPKDGPSAGITMATALVSLVSGRSVREDTAMTGELTLTGQVLPIGGLKEKSLAAQAHGITRVIAPKLNEEDVDEIPAHLRADLEFVFVEEIGEVLAAALEPAGVAANADGKGAVQLAKKAEKAAHKGKEKDKDTAGVTAKEAKRAARGA